MYNLSTTSLKTLNNTAAYYTYDDLNRLILLENRRSDTSLISGYAYTLGLSGNRLRVTEHTGRIESDWGQTLIFDFA